MVYISIYQYHNILIIMASIVLFLMHYSLMFRQSKLFLTKLNAILSRFLIFVGNLIGNIFFY